MFVRTSLWMALFGRRIERQRSRYRPTVGQSGDTRLVRAGTVLAVLEAAEIMGFPRATWFDGLGIDAKRLAKRGERVGWNVLVDTLEALEAAGMSAEDFVRMGELAASAPGLLIGRFIGLVARPDHMLYVGIKWLGPTLFPMLEREFDYRGKEMTLRVRIPDELRGSEAYFHITRGCLAATPTLIDHPQARVVADISAQSAVMEIDCQSAYRSRFGLRRLTRALLSVPGILEILSEQDVAIRRGLEQVVRHQDDFRRVLEMLPEAVMVYSPDRLLYVNPHLRALLGYEDETWMSAASWGTLLSDSDRARLDDARQTAGEFRFRSRDGAAVILELSAAQDIEFEGHAARLVVARDVTARREIEQQMAIADRLSSLGTLSAGIAHEINNPLALIYSNLELARRACRDRDHDRVTGHLDAALDGTERVKEIAQDLRVFSQPAQEEATLVDVADVVRSTVALARGQARGRARLEMALSGTPAVLGIRSRVGQVLLNLVLNALQALPDRSDEENLVRVTLTHSGDQVVVEVEDNGGGIPDSARDHLFEPFFSTKRATTGTGLGLAVAHGIVQSMGGEISFDSELGRGTVFRVSLPAAGEVPASAASPPVAPDLSASGSGRVLVVDDEQFLRDVLSGLLSDSGYEVVVAESGNAALALLERGEQFDAVLCDLMMTDGSGLDVFRHVEAAHAALRSRIVFMTGGVYRDDVREFLARVDNPCLAKPFSADELQRAVEAVLHPGVGDL